MSNLLITFKHNLWPCVKIYEMTGYFLDPHQFTYRSVDPMPCFFLESYTLAGPDESEMLKLLEQCDLRASRSATPSAASLSPGSSMMFPMPHMPRYAFSNFSLSASNGGQSVENMVDSDQHVLHRGQLRSSAGRRTNRHSVASERGFTSSGGHEYHRETVLQPPLEEKGQNEASEK